MIDPFSGLPCAVGEIYGVPRMTFHGNVIALGHYSMAVTMIKRGLARLPFPNPNVTKVDDIANDIVLWHEKDLVYMQIVHDYNA
jgi:hypothetical protein